VSGRRKNRSHAITSPARASAFDQRVEFGRLLEWHTCGLTPVKDLSEEQRASPKQVGTARPYDIKPTTSANDRDDWPLWQGNRHDNLPIAMRSKYSDYAKAVLLAFHLGNAHFYIAAAIHDA
jgi:hypothetical protein